MRLKCSCGNIVVWGAEHAGRTITCPRCGKVWRIPASAGAPPARGDEEQGWAEEEFELAGHEIPGPDDHRSQRRTRPPRSGSVEETGPEGAEEEEFELEGPEPSGPKAEAGRQEGSAPEGTGLEDLGEEEFELVGPPPKEPDEEQAAAEPPAQALAPAATQLQEVVEEDAEPDNVVSLFWMCLRGPYSIGEVEQALVRRKVLFLQIVVLFALLVTVPALLETRSAVVQQFDSRLIAFESKLLHKALEVAVALPVLYIFLLVLGSRMPLLTLAGVLLFIRLMASVLVAGLGVVGAVSFGLYKVGLALPRGWNFALGLSFWVYIGVAIFYQVRLLQSRSDISGFGAFMVNAPMLAAYWFIGTRYMSRIMLLLGLWGGPKVAGT